MAVPPVVHVVLVRWNPDVVESELIEVTAAARALEDAIPGILAIHCGPNSSPEGLGDGFDWALVVSFSSSSARDGYLPHPAHLPVAEMISRLSSAVVVFDVDA